MTTRSATQLEDMEKQKQMMETWNEKLKDHKDVFLPKNIGKMENTEHYKMFMED